MLVASRQDGNSGSQAAHTHLHCRAQLVILHVVPPRTQTKRTRYSDDARQWKQGPSEKRVLLLRQDTSFPGIILLAVDGREGHGYDALLAKHGVSCVCRSVAQPGSASALGAESRGFEDRKSTRLNSS